MDEEGENMEYANFKMKCVDNKHNEYYYTIGRIYEVKDGFFLGDNEQETPRVNFPPIKDFEDWQHRTTAKWELVENIEESQKLPEVNLTGMVNCEVCGKTFLLSIEERYTATNTIFLTGVTTEYDAFDCPHCGCQYVTGTRLPRKFEKKGGVAYQ